MKKILFWGLSFSALFAEATMYGDIQKGDAVVIELFGKRLGFENMDWAKVEKNEACVQTSCEGDKQVKCYRGFKEEVGDNCQDTQRTLVKEAATEFVGKCQTAEGAGSGAGGSAAGRDGLGGTTPAGGAITSAGPGGTTPAGGQVGPDGVTPGGPGGAALAIGAGAIGAAALVAANLGGDNNTNAVAAAAVGAPGVIPGVRMALCQTPVAIGVEGARLKALHDLQSLALDRAPAIPNVTNNPKASHDGLYAATIADLDAIANLANVIALQTRLYNTFGNIHVQNSNGQLVGYFDAALAQGIVDMGRCIYNLGTVPDITAGVTALANAMR